MSRLQAFQCLVPVIIIIDCFISSCMVINFNSDKDSYDRYDYHARNIAIATVTFISFMAVYLWCLCNSEHNEEAKFNIGIVTFKIVMFTILTCGTYFIFSTVYAIYALQHDFITSGDRSIGNRKAALVITASALFNWSIIIILRIAKHFEPTKQSITLDDSVEPPSRVNSITRPRPNSVANISVIINMSDFHVSATPPEYSRGDLPGYSRPPSYCSRIVEFNDYENSPLPAYQDVCLDITVGNFLMESDLSETSYLDAIDLNTQGPSDDGAGLY